MIVRPQDKINILISGSFVAFTLVIVAVSIFMLSSENNLFSRRINLSIEVENAQNLKRGAEVQLRGIKIGSVRSIEVGSLDHLVITMNVGAHYQDWIRQDSYVAFKTHGVLGDRYIEILGGTEDQPVVKDGQQLLVKDDSVLDKFITRGEDILVVAGRVLHKVDIMLEVIEKNRIQSILANLDETTKSTASLMKAINSKDLASLLKNLNASSESMARTMSSMENISGTIEQGPGSLHSLIYDRSVHDDLKTILGGTKRNRVLQYFIRESIKKAD